MSKMKKFYLIILTPLILLVLNAKSVFAESIPIPTASGSLPSGIPSTKPWRFIISIGTILFIVLTVIITNIVIVYKRLKKAKEEKKNNAIDENTKHAMDVNIESKHMKLVRLSITLIAIIPFIVLFIIWACVS